MCPGDCLPSKHRPSWAGCSPPVRPSPVSLAISARGLPRTPGARVVAGSGGHPSYGCHRAASRAYEVSGDVTPATEHEVAAAVALIRTSDNPFTAVSSICLLARLHVLQGRLRQAAATYAQVVQAVPRPEVLQTMFTSLSYYFGLGDLLREWNDLDAAERHLVQGMALVNETLTVEPFVAMLGYTALARLQQARGNTREALATLDALAHLAEQRHFAPHLVTQVAAVRAQLELAQGNLAAAIRWADASGLSTEDDDLRYPHEGEYLALARVRIAQARDDPAVLSSRMCCTCWIGCSGMPRPKHAWAACWKSSSCVRWPWRHKGIERVPSPPWNGPSCSPNQRATSVSSSTRARRCWPCCARLTHAVAYRGTSLPSCRLW